MNKKDFSEYFRTFIFTIFFVAIVSSVMVARVKLLSQRNIAEDEATIQSDMIGYLIEKYRFYETQDPNNPQLTLKIAVLYDMFGSAKQAENEYLKAYEKTGYSSDSILFRLANLYLTTKRYDDALKVVNGVKDSPKYSVIMEKGLFFSRYGDLMLNAKRYEDAIKSYNRAEFYFDKIEYKNRKSLLTQKCVAYTELADVMVTQNRTTEAIEALQKALNIAKNPIIYYKLAILNIERDPLLAVKYLDIVNKNDPSIINYDLYRQVLLNLQLRYISLGDILSADLYKTKYDRLNYQIHSNYLYPDEVNISNVNVKIKTYPIIDKAKVALRFSIQNTTNIPIDRLSLTADFRTPQDNFVFKGEEEIVTPKSKLEPNTQPQEYTMVIKTKKKLLKHNPDLTLNIYLTKNPRYVVQLAGKINVKYPP